MDEQIIKEYKTGSSLDKIAKMYNLTKSKVYLRLKKLNIPTRNLSESHITKQCNYDFFSDIDSEEKAYWLGFLYADGSITHNSMKLTLHPKDEDHLKKFKKIIGSNHNFINDRGYIRFSITNKKLYNDLISKGCLERKTFTISFPKEDILPKKFTNHFIRGYFDGDGTIYFSINKKYNYIQWKFEIISNFNFLSDLYNHLESYCNLKRNIKLYKEKRRSSPIFYLKIGGQSLNDIEIIYKYLYSNSSVFLDRKRKKFIEIIKKIKYDSK